MAHLSHAWIVVSSAPEERELQAAALAAAIVCRQQNGASCGQCRDCRKALAGIHPDIIRMERETGEDGKPRRELYVNQIRALCVDAYVLPNEAARKVYIIPEADKMNEAAQNALLPIIDRAYKNGTIITVCSQCSQGAVSLGTYAASSALRRVGAVNGRDMTTEAALAKSYYLLSISDDMAFVKAQMQKSLRGELTE